MSSDATPPSGAETKLGSTESGEYHTPAKPMGEEGGPADGTEGNSSGGSSDAEEPKLPLSDVELAQLENERLRADLREAQEQRDQLAAALNIKTRHYARTVISLEEAKALLAAQCTVVDGYATRLSSAEEMAVVAAAQILEADELRQALCLTRLQLAELKTIFASVHGVVTAVRTAKDLRAIAKWAGAGQPALDAARQVALGVPPAPLGEEAAHNMRLLNPSLPKVNYKEPLSPGGEAALRAMLEADGETGEDAYQRALRINMSADEDASDGAQGGGAGGGSAGGEGGAGAGDKRPRGKGAGGKNGPGGHGKKPRPGGGNGGASGSGTRPEPKRKSYYIGEVRFSRPQSAWSQMMASGNRACFHCKAEGHVLAQCTNPVPGYPDVVRHGKK